MTNSERSSKPEIAVYLGLGSNIGRRKANLGEAIRRLEALGIEVVRESSIYETEPVGFSDQPWFLNQVIEAKFPASSASQNADPTASTIVRAEALLSELLKIEREMGRARTIVNGPRLIDIDLLLFGNLIVAHPKQGEGLSLRDRTDCVVPHPRMHLRRFVLEPLCEIAPDLVHPLLKKPCRELLASIDDPSVVRRYARGGSEEP